MSSDSAETKAACGESSLTDGLGLMPSPDWWHYKINGEWDGFSRVRPPDDAYDEGTLIPLYAKEPASVESVAAGLTFCCGKEEKLTLEIAALRNVVQSAMIAGCVEAFSAWNYHFPDNQIEPYKKPNAPHEGPARASCAGPLDAVVGGRDAE